MAKRGVNLLLDHLKGGHGSFEKAILANDEAQLAKESDALVTVAAIFIRMLRDQLGGTVESTLVTLRVHPSLQTVPHEQLVEVEKLISRVIDEGYSPPIAASASTTAVVSHSIAISAATEISRYDGRHVNQVIADLHNQLKVQGDDVQITDRASARKASDKYAADTKMREARQETAYKTVDYWHRAAVALHNASLADNLSDDCVSSLEALALVTVTGNALTAGVYQLAAHGNVYPAMALVRQLVEIEFISWRFRQDVTLLPAWLKSTPDERRRDWKPSKIYRDSDNEYRQKDYWQHCEVGGHPTPVGAKVITNTSGSYVPMAGLFSECIAHSWDAWCHIVETAKMINLSFGLSESTVITAINSEFAQTIEHWVAIDLYRQVVAFYSDPIG